MSEGTKIEWAHATKNPWEGCTKVSAGCANCYAEARNIRFAGGKNWGRGAPRRRTAPEAWREALRWNAKAPQIWNLAPASRRWPLGERGRVFPSLCDWLDEEVPIDWLADFLKLIHDTPNLDWLLLTKRPEKWQARIIAAHASLDRTAANIPLSSMLVNWCGGDAPANVWIGTSVENRQTADERIPALLAIPAKVRFLSVEPLLGPVDLAYSCFNGADPCGSMPGIHWVIVGGESGTNARPCNIEWIRFIIAQCKWAGVACFVKQLGSVVVSRGITGPGQHWPELRLLCPRHEFDFNGEVLWRHNLLHSKGGDPGEWPEDLRVREFPGGQGAKVRDGVEAILTGEVRA